MDINQAYNSLIEIISNTPLKNYFSESIERLKIREQNSTEQDIRVGVIGVTSSGKSTLINAFLGEGLLPMKGKPSSSQLVSCRKSETRRARIEFEDGRVKELNSTQLTHSEIEKYGDEALNTKNREKVSHIFIYSPKFEFPENLQLVDSPGLDAYNLENHEKLTMSVLLPTVDFCIFVTTCKSNSDSKMASCINEFAKHDKKLIVVQNMADAVKASLDGKKSKEDVAKDAMKKVRNVIEQSKYKDKSSVQIIQISSKLALAYRSGESSDEDEFAKSNYNYLIEAINNNIESAIPQIQNGKIRILKNIIEELVSKANEQVRNLQNQLNNKQVSDVVTSFPLDKEKRALRDYRNQTTKNFMKIVNESITSIYNYIDGISNMKQANLDKVNSMLEDLTSDISCQIEGVYGYLGDKLEEYNLDSHSAYAEIYIPKSSKVKSDTYTVTNWCGCSDTKTNYEGNKANARRSVKSWNDAFNGTLSQLGNHIELVINSKLVPEYERRKREIDKQNEESQRIASDRNNIQKHINEFNSLINSIKQIESQISFNKTINKNVEDRVASSLKDVSVAVSKDFFALYNLSNKIMQKIHTNVIKSFLYEISKGNSNLIVGWDENCLKSFMFNSFSVNVYDNCLRDGVVTKLDKNNDIVLNPQNGYQKYDNIFVLYNTTQLGQAESQIFRSNILTSKCKNYIFVSQDFREFADNLKEYLPYIKNSLTQKMGLKKCYYLFNDKNPLLDMAAICVQLGYIKNQTQEIEFIRNVKKQYPEIYTKEAEGYISQIIKSN